MGNSPAVRAATTAGHLAGWLCRCAGGIVAAQGVGVALKIECPRCGLRPHTEFAFGGEVRGLPVEDPDADFARVYLRANPAGNQTERWFHAFGCRRWLTLTRDTVTNRTDAVDRVRG